MELSFSLINDFDDEFGLFDVLFPEEFKETCKLTDFEDLLKFELSSSITDFDFFELLTEASITLGELEILFGFDSCPFWLTPKIIQYFVMKKLQKHKKLPNKHSFINELVMNLIFCSNFTSIIVSI